MTGVGLPEVDLGPFGGRLGLGEGRALFSFARVGQALEARLSWQSDSVVWTASPGEPTSEAARDALPGSRAWARDLVWRTLTGVRSVELEMALTGSLEDPSLTVASNLGDAVAESLRRELGREIEDAEARVRAEVDRHVQPLLLVATERVDALQTEVGDRVAEQRRELDELRARLEARIEELIGAAPGR